MAKQEQPVEAARKINGDVSNPTLIEWPFDQYGITSLLKTEGVQAIQRVSGDPEKAEVVLSVLQCLAQHLKARLPDQRAAIAQQVAAAEAAAAVAQEVVVSAAMRGAEVARQNLAAAEAKLAAVEGGAA